jgi:hypothetical protein
VKGQRHAPTALYPWEKRGTHCTEGWVGPRAGLDRCEKSRPPPGFDPRTVQPVTSRYIRFFILLQNPAFRDERIKPKSILILSIYFFFCVELHVARPYVSLITRSPEMAFHKRYVL